MNKRDLYWDSLKFILIFLVVFGHILEHFSPDGSFNRALFNFIYIFHMPLFIFISGRFSHIKDRKRYKLSILKIFETYIVFQFLIILDYALQSGDPLSPRWAIQFYTHPQYAMWYLFSLAIWRIVIYIAPQRLLNDYRLCIICICFIISLLCGFIPISGNFAFQRTLAFLPFFFLGYYSADYNFKKWVDKTPIYLSIIGVLFAFIIIYVYFNRHINHVICCALSYYSRAEVAPITFCSFRAMALIAAIIVGTMVVRLTAKKELFAKWGKSTLFIYCYQFITVTLTIVVVKHGSLPSNALFILLYTLVSVLILLFLSRFAFFRFFLNPFSNILERKKKC